ncbi:hypothetical protein [Allorhizocola rhizosphaerae]|uniref:hypothetical protein n=1 Tax=Allorhizocola rhizosphaerae TaxID=1872709 RepID=UPI000E3C8B5E|nr:hypothetical protein [Allorhizocola rhizosphaerae]
MPLHLPEPPNGAPDDVRSKLRKFAEEGKFTGKALHGARKEQLDVSTPHQVFTMGLDDVLAGGGVDRARPAGWRYLIEEAGQPIASAETSAGPDGTQEVSQFTEGPFVAATDKAMKIVRKLPKLEAAGFELRLLRIPAVYQMALWLHSAEEDLLVPLEPSSIGKEGKAMPADEFFNDLAELARATSFRAEPD